MAQRDEPNVNVSSSKLNSARSLSHIYICLEYTNIPTENEAHTLVTHLKALQDYRYQIYTRVNTSNIIDLTALVQRRDGERFRMRKPTAFMFQRCQPILSGLKSTNFKNIMDSYVDWRTVNHDLADFATTLSSDQGVCYPSTPSFRNMLIIQPGSRRIPQKSAELPHPPTKRPRIKEREDAVSLPQKVSCSSTKIFDELKASTSSYIRGIAKQLRSQQMLFLDSDIQEEEVPEIFTQIALGFPMIVPSRQCWENDPPTTRDFFELCLISGVRSSAQVFDDSEGIYQSSDLASVLAQLLQPDPCKPIHAFNLRPPERHVLQEDFIIPNILNTIQQVQARWHDTTFNITPAFFVVEPHHDGSWVLSHSIDSCEKIWFLWPPTEDNMAHLESLRAGSSRLGRCKFEHGVITKLSGVKAIFIPPCWIHATITTHGGFLVGSTGEDARSILIVSRCFRSDLEFDALSALGDSRPYREVLISALASTRQDIIHTAITSWCGISNVLQNLPSEQAEKSAAKSSIKELVDVWYRFTKEVNAHVEETGCCTPDYQSEKSFYSAQIEPLRKIIGKKGSSVSTTSKPAKKKKKK